MLKYNKKTGEFEDSCKVVTNSKKQLLKELKYNEKTGEFEEGSCSNKKKSVQRKSSVEFIVKSIIVETLGVDKAEVTNESSFTDDLDADSLDIVELIMAFEKEFGISIPDDEVDNISTVGDAIDYIERYK